MFQYVLLATSKLMARQRLRSFLYDLTVWFVQLAKNNANRSVRLQRGLKHGPIYRSSVASRSQTLGGIVRARINRQQARTSLSLRLQVGLVLSRPRLSSV